MKKQVLFKFRPVETVEQLIRVIDSINKNRMFFPNYKNLNDPLESSGVLINLSGYAGKSIIEAADDEDSIVHNIRNEYRILALTENCFSPIMWAHYANGYKGVCIGYWKSDTFSSAQKIEYIEKQQCAKNADKNGCVDDNDDLELAVCDSFFYKHSAWSYEKEWRIVRKQDDHYFNYNSSDLACIVFGHNLDKEIRDFLISSIKEKVNVPMYRTQIGYRSFGINLLPIDYEMEMDGSEPPYIRDVDTLRENIIGAENNYYATI